MEVAHPALQKSQSDFWRLVRLPLSLVLSTVLLNGATFFANEATSADTSYLGTKREQVGRIRAVPPQRNTGKSAQLPGSRDKVLQEVGARL